MKRPTAHARVQITVDIIVGGGAWGEECTVSQVHSQAVDSARGALRGGLVIDGLSRHTSEKTGAVIVGEPKVTMVILEDR